MEPILELSLLDYEEKRDIEAIRHPSIPDRIAELRPVEGSERVWLNLGLPNGQEIRVEVSYKDFEEKLVPLMGLRLKLTPEELDEALAPSRGSKPAADVP